ncbi:MAG: hypothetical protein JKY49_00370 [Cohaesibacteraceae bacterium]|nr:hypothetical protein [Cohaesibacteraceae bacterium]MBL4875752.1 hypothetical protein [Cohaesibacteraceae bacterium]
MSASGDIEELIRQLGYFSSIDNNMQVGTILALLQVALAVSRGGHGTTELVEKKVGMGSGTASRNVRYWGSGHKSMSKAMKYMTNEMDPEDNRKRVLRLTHTGEAFIDKIMTTPGTKRELKGDGQKTG